MALPDALLLDAGRTFLFVDHDAMRAALVASGHDVSAAALRDSEQPAHRHYAERLREGAGHEDGWRAFMQLWIELAGVPPAASRDAVVALRRAHDDFNFWRRVPPEVPPALEQVRAAGIRLGVVSNSEGGLARLLERVGLHAAFDVVVDSGVEGCSKPDPEIFWRACRRLGVAPARCVYAGDLPEVDVVGARRAGIAPVLIDEAGAHEAVDAPRYPSLAAFIADLLSRAGSAP